MDKRIKFVKDNPKPKKEFKNLIKVIEMERYATPSIVEERNAFGKQFVKWGENNDYYSKLIELYTSSATNSRCINGICDMIYGKGLNATDSMEKPKMFLEMKKLINPEDLKRVIINLKQLGSGALQVVYNKDKTRIKKLVHTPIETWRAAKAVEGVVKKYYYHPSWKDYKINDKLKELPTFGNGSNKETVELYIFKPYRSGFYYYSPVDYQGCIQYCDLEKETSNYHINNIKNGLQPSLMINFNNGVPPKETQDEVERMVLGKFSGTSNSGRAIIAFNDDAEDAATIEPIHLPDAHAQYQFMADEAREKIMLGHGIGSPILLGIKDNTGFGNNAEEIRTASILMDNHVIRPFQQLIIDGLNQLLLINSVVLNLYFETLQPIEFTDADNIKTKIRREEETGEKLSLESITELTDFEEEDGDDILGQLEALGELISDEWEVIHSEVVKDSETPFKMPESLSDASPNKPSSQDSGVFKVRYAYMPLRKSPVSRNFCKHMERFTTKNVVFRKEDINMMSFRGVNKELGHNKQNYSLFKFKGGKNCHHYWELRVYRKKVKDGNEVSSGNVDVSNPKEIGVRPVDMPNKGAHPNAKK